MMNDSGPRGIGTRATLGPGVQLEDHGAAGPMLPPCLQFEFANINMGP